MEYAEKKQTHEALQVITFGTHTISAELQEKSEITCVKCDKIWAFPESKHDYLAHLFLEHRLVIADVDDIALLEDYLQYWHKEFNGHDLEEYCTTMLLDQLPDGTPAKNEKYYLLSDVLPRDYELRKQLQQQRLERALTLHQFERTDRSFSKECLYCRDVISGLRADFLEHLFCKHFLQLGKPENLVYVDELLAHVQQNLEQLVCLYCEKIFKDRVTLKEHMRKKAHKRINPNNRAYDRYFLINYRYEKPKQTSKNIQRNRETQKEPQCSRQTTHKTLSSIENIEEGSVDFEQRFKNEDDSDSEWDDWGGEQIQALNCLFCTQQENTFDLLKQHMLLQHQLDFDAAVNKLNFYQKIKVVNYVRRQMRLLRCVSCDIRCESAELLLQHLTEEQHVTLGTQKQWDKPEFFFPTYEDDGLLCILDDINANDNDVDEAVVRIISEDSLGQINKDAERLSLENFKFL